MILDVEKLVFIRPMIDNFPDFHNTNDASALFIYLHFILSWHKNNITHCLK